MAAAIGYPHLTEEANGVVRVGKTRYKVCHLAGEHYHLGWTAEELLRQHPDLRPEEVYSALTYFYDHFDDMISELQDSPAAIPVQPFSRQELLDRRTGVS